MTVARVCMIWSLGKVNEKLFIECTLADTSYQGRSDRVGGGGGDFR
jgi:hypothetical protein